jgi:hypothetical protein
LLLSTNIFCSINRKKNSSKILNYQIKTQLLQRNPKKRLGYESDGEDIKKHPFFKGLNWNDLYAR